MKLASVLVEKAVEQSIVSSDEKSLYIYAIENMLFSACTWLTLIIMGIIEDCLLYCILFIASYVPLRVFAGGFHLGTRTRCYLYSLVVFVTLILGCKYCASSPQSTVDYMITAAATVVIFLLSPVADLNKPLSETERQHSMKMTRIILLLNLAAILLFERQIKNTYITFFLVASIRLVAIQLILGILRNKYLLFKQSGIVV